MLKLVVRLVLPWLGLVLLLSPLVSSLTFGRHFVLEHLKITNKERDSQKKRKLALE